MIVTNTELWGLFHKLWSRDVGTQGYNKEDWMRLQQILFFTERWGNDVRQGRKLGDIGQENHNKAVGSIVERGSGSTLPGPLQSIGLGMGSGGHPISDIANSLPDSIFSKKNERHNTRASRSGGEIPIQPIVDSRENAVADKRFTPSQYHVIPAYEGRYLHEANPRCWCRPRLDTVEKDGDLRNEVWIHCRD